SAGGSARRSPVMPPDNACAELVGRSSDERQRFHKAKPFCGGQRIKQRALRSFRCKTSPAKRATANGRDGNGVRARILFGSAPGQKPVIQHAPNHFCER